METTMLIQPANEKAIELLHQLEELHLIKVLKENINSGSKFTNKYRGIISRKEGQKLKEHIKQMRNEWSGI